MILAYCGALDHAFNIVDVSVHLFDEDLADWLKVVIYLKISSFLRGKEPGKLLV